jgi:DNA gyrase subunit A
MAHWLKVYELPQAGRASKGRPIVNMLQLEAGERIQAVIPVDKFDDQRFLVMITKNGQICKNALSLYSNPRKVGIKAINIQKGDELVEVRLLTIGQEIFIATMQGMAVRFNEEEVRPMGRFVQGVRAVNLGKGDEVIDMEVLRPNATILTVCEHGFGKRTDVEEYRMTHRGAKGVINIRCTDRNGNVVAAKEVLDGDELMLMTEKGQTIRFRVSDVRVIGRNTQGVRLFHIEEGDRVTAVSRVEDKDVDEEVTEVLNVENGSPTPPPEEAPDEEPEE